MCATADAVTRRAARLRSRHGRGLNARAYFDFLVKVPQVQGTGFLGYVAYEGLRLDIYDDRFEVGSQVHLAPTAGYRNIGIRAAGPAAAGPQDGVYIDGVHVFAVNVSAAAVTPRGMFGTRTPPGASEGVNGVELLDFFAYVKSFHRTLDPQPQDGDAPTITVTFFDGPMPVTTYELENLNPALPPHAEGPTGDPTGMFLPSCPALGVPLMETDADGALLSRGRVDGFGLSISGGGDPITPEGGFNRDQIYCLVNGRRSTAAVVGDGTLLGAAAATPELRWVFTTDAVGTSTSFARQQAGDSQTLDSFGGGAGTPTALASPPVWDTANIPLTFGTTAPPREDRTTSARPLRPESEVGPTTVQNTDAGFNTDDGDCLCRGCDPSKQTVTRKNDASTGATTTLNDGAYADTGYGAYVSSGSTPIYLLNPGWNPKDTHESLDKADKKLYEDIWKAGKWKFAGNSDGTDIRTGIGGDSRHIDANIDDAEWAKKLAEGQDVQWGELKGGGKWAIDFESRLIYVDAEDNETAKRILEHIASRIRVAPQRNIEFANFHDDKNWQCFKGELAALDIPKTWVENRRYSQIGYINTRNAISALSDAFESIYGFTGVGLQLAAAFVPLTTLAKLAKFMKWAKWGKHARAGTLKLLGKAGKAGEHIRDLVGDADDALALFAQLTRGHVKEVKKDVVLADGSIVQRITRTMRDGNSITYYPQSSFHKSPGIHFAKKIDGVEKIHFRGQ